jgi:diaminopimelate decarboxylase
MNVHNGKLEFEGFSAEDLCARFGSPLYVYEEQVLRRQCRRLRQGFGSDVPIEIHYACKANTNLVLLGVLRDEGCMLDAVSPGEIRAGLRAGFTPGQILYTCNNASDAELRDAHAAGVLTNLDSICQIRRWGRLFPGTQICVRINPGMGGGHHDHCITGGPDSKFGVYHDQLDDLRAAAAEARLVIRGLHQHIGSGILDPDVFIEAIELLAGCATGFPDITFLDFGGGLGVPYKPDEQQLDIEALRVKTTECFRHIRAALGRELTLKIEPGRYLAAEAGTLLATVNSLKETPEHVFAGTDSGFSHLIRPAFYGSYHPLMNASNMDGPVRAYSVTGNLCESGDVFCHDRELPEIREGDVLAIGNAGAYGYAMSSVYNSRPRPAEVLITDGAPRLIRKRESLDDLFRLDV